MFQFERYYHPISLQTEYNDFIRLNIEACRPNVSHSIADDRFF